MWDAFGVPSGKAALLEQLIHRYAEPHRHYHTLQHLEECLAQLADAHALASHPHEIAYALWFHDAIYDVRSHDNEWQSANWARTEAMAAGIAADAANRIHDLIMDTRHDAKPDTGDGQLLVDIDLSILGAEPARFDEYERQVRAEYAWVPEPVFREKRLAILQGFLDRSCLYNTAYFMQRLEDKARANLRRSVSRLQHGVPS